MLTIDIRHQLHNHPEVSGAECCTHDLIVQELALAHPDRIYDHVGGHGVVAVWGGAFSHPTVAIRGDIDALPIGHRCGHDGHTAILLQLATMVAQDRHDKNNVILIFQPEEETGKGAQKILDSGILQQYDIRAIFGLHNLPGYPMGTVVLNKGTFAAASSGVTYHLEGRPTHASTPEKGLNPGLAAAEIIQQMQQLNTGDGVTNEMFRQSTLIGARIGAAAFGTAAGEGEVMFTLRAFANATMEQLIHDANQKVYTIANHYQLALSHQLEEPFRATENRPELVEYIEECCGCPSIHTHTPFRWSEDFANYLQSFPGAMFGVGAGEQHVELHHPEYDFPDELIEPAAQVLHRLLPREEQPILIRQK